MCSSLSARFPLCGPPLAGGHYYCYCHCCSCKIPPTNNFKLHVFSENRFSLHNGISNTSRPAWHSPLNIMLKVSFLLAVTVLVVIAGFPLFGPPRENSYCRFATNPFLSPLAGYFFDFFHTNHRQSSKMFFLLICLPPGRRLLLAPGMGMGGGAFGTIWHHFGTTLRQFVDQF